MNKKEDLAGYIIVMFMSLVFLITLLCAKKNKKDKNKTTSNEVNKEESYDYNDNIKYDNFKYNNIVNYNNCEGCEDYKCNSLKVELKYLRIINNELKDEINNKTELLNDQEERTSDIQNEYNKLYKEFNKVKSECNKYKLLNTNKSMLLNNLEEKNNILQNKYNILDIAYNKVSSLCKEKEDKETYLESKLLKKDTEIEELQEQLKFLQEQLGDNNYNVLEELKEVSELLSEQYTTEYLKRESTVMSISKVKELFKELKNKDLYVLSYLLTMYSRYNNSNEYDTLLCFIDEKGYLKNGKTLHRSDVLKQMNDIYEDTMLLETVLDTIYEM